MEKKEVLDGGCILPLGPQSRSAVRSVSVLPRHSSPGRQTVLAEILVAGNYPHAQPVRRGLSQLARPTGEPSVQIRVASPARNFGDRMHDPPDSRARCFSSVQCAPTAQSGGALLFGALAPVGASASRRPPVGSQIKCLGMGAQAKQTTPALGAQTVSTIRSQTSGSGIWMWLETIALEFPDRYLRQRYHSGHGSFSKSSSSLTPCPILAAASAEVPSPKTDRLSFRKVPHTWCAIIRFQATVNY